MDEKRLFDYLSEQLKRFPQEHAFGSRVNGAWLYFSTAEMVRRVDRTSHGLLQLGLQPGDKVASVVYQTTPDWVVLDFALQQIGVLHVPMYPTISPREYAYILQESEARYCVVGAGDLYEKVRKAAEQTPSLRQIFSFDEQTGVPHWSTLLSDGDPADLERRKAAVRPDDVMTLVYTSGTTGNPKGVMLTHRNIIFNVEAAQRIIPFQPGDRVLSFLPVSHVYERVAVYAYTAYGASVSFTGTDNLGGETGDLRAIRPHWFTSVPRLLEKVYEKIYAKGFDLKGFKRFVFFWALRLTERWQYGFRPRGLAALKWFIADRLVFSKWREALGGNLKCVITAASACPQHVIRTFCAAGIPVLEGYGLTEVAPALSFNSPEPGGALLGTVGPPIEGVEIFLEPGPEFRPGEGEIVARTPGLMVGYYKQPEKTAEMIRVIDGERWIATGDVGTWVEGPGGVRFLKITDRKKELLKTSGGKYVAPAPLESALKEHPLVEQAMIVGDNFKFVSALLVPSEEGLKDWCRRHEVPWTSLAEMVRHPRVLERYQMLLDRLNPYFGHFEQIKKFVLLPTLWEPVKADGTEAELTPTLKLKRRVILEKYRREIEGMYG